MRLGKFRLRTAMILIAISAVLLSLFISFYPLKPSPSELRSLMCQSDTFQETAKSGLKTKYSQAELRDLWREERRRLEKIQAGIEDERASLVHVKTLYHLGIACMELSEGQGSARAEKYFHQATRLLRAMRSEKMISAQKYQEHNNAISKARRANEIMLDN